MPEIDKYIISKILFFIFGSTTVIIFFLFYTGVFVNIVGSIEAAITIYCINTVLLIPITIWYAIERSHKPKYKESDILEAYSEMMSRTDDESVAKETTKQQWKNSPQNKRAIPNILYGELTNINVELLFRDLFVLRNRFKELGMVIKNGEVHLLDLEERDV